MDGEKNDRALLGLALRSTIPALEVLDAPAPVDAAHFAGAGRLDAVIVDAAHGLAGLSNFAVEARRRHPACLYVLFGHGQQLPGESECIGRGIDARFEKISAGYLALPNMLFDRLRAVRELLARFPDHPGALLSAVFPGATCLVADDGTLLSVSREFEELVAQPRFRLIGSRLDQFWLESAERQEWNARLAHAAGPWTFVGRMQTQPGHNAQISASLKLLEPASMQDRVWAVSLVDISEATGSRPDAGGGEDDRINFEQLTFALSHDLQAPLNSLERHAKWLRDAMPGDAGDEVISTVAEIAELTSRMQVMLDSMVQFAVLKKEDAGREIVNLDTVLAEAMANLDSVIEESTATIERQSLPTLLVNRNQMVQVFQNLLNNAIKFCDSHVPRVRVSASEHGGVWEIQFEDNGIGIESGETERIFEMFKRLHGESEYPGIGAGLAICRRIIEAHGGRITVRSTPGRGSCFKIELRAASEKAAVGTPTTRVVG